MTEQTDAILDGYEGTVRQYRERVAALEAERDEARFSRDMQAKWVAEWHQLALKQEARAERAEAEVERLRLFELLYQAEREPNTHWESLRDLRRAALAALEEAKP